MSLDINNLNFKSPYHNELFLYFFEALNSKNDIDYVVFCYVASAAGKKEIIKYLSKDGIKGDSIISMIQPYSSGEKMLILFALSLFNSYYKQPILDDLFYSLDNDLKKVIIVALKIKYKIIL